MPEGSSVQGIQRPIVTVPASARRPWAPAYGSLASRTEALDRADRRGSQTKSRPSRWMSGGLEPCRCSRPARDAAPTIAPTIFCSDRLAADAGPGRRARRIAGVTGWRSLALVDAATNSQESSPRPSMRPTSWGSARNRRARTGREAVEMAGVVLGYRASWHDRGPGGRHDDGARSRGRGHPPPPKPA